MTTETGLTHALRTHEYYQLDRQARGLINALRPEVRAEIVRRWAQAEGTSVHVTEGKFIALDIPGTDFRISLMGGGLSEKGLNLSQQEATQLLLARPEGEPPGSTLLQMLPGLPQDHAPADYHLIGAAIGADGSLLPGVDPDAAYALAAPAHDKVFNNSGDVSLRERFARFFSRVGDNRRAAQSREIVATIRAEMRPAENMENGEVAREGLTTIGEVRRFNQMGVAENRRWAGFHYARANEPRMAASQYLKSAASFAGVGDQVMAARMYASALEKMATFDVFPKVGNVLTQAIEGYKSDVDGASRISARCADAFVARGLYVSAAMIHELAAEALDAVGAGPASTLATSHREMARTYFASVGLSSEDRDFAAMIRTAIDANLEALASDDGLQRQGYAIRFEDKCDFISAEEFDVQSPTEWVLLRRGKASDAKHVYDLMTDASRQRLLETKNSRHPYRQDPLSASDFIDDVAALDMLLSPATKDRASADASEDIESTDL
ncbi:hypothetical protein [Pandoraea anhela]|nr:hypothetical protein [Pandoraea anhela]